MNKSTMATFFRNTKLFVDKHSPEILTGIGIAGMITTTVLAVKATPKALQLIEAKKKEDGVDKLPAKDVIKVAWKPYVPAAITGGCSVACLIGASSVNVRRNAALATAYKISETALSEYREKVIETVGESKEKQIREKVAKEQVEKASVNTGGVIVTDMGNTLCLDVISGRYFRSDIDRIKKVANELNRQMLTDPFGYISVNEFYDELGLEHISVGDEIGWNVSGGLIDIDLGSCLTPSGVAGIPANVPCVVINYTVAPKYDYSSYS